VVAALIALALAVFVFKAGAATAGEVYVPTRPLVVTSGDTLWSIAEELSIPGRDVQDVVIELQRINGLTGSRIQAGDVLEVPRK
jgi:LysM repeat protein